MEIDQNFLGILCEEEFIGGTKLGGTIKTHRGLRIENSQVHVFDSVYKIYSK